MDLTVIFKLIQEIHFFRSRKLLSLRLFEDRDGKRWQKSVQDENFEILCVSQFTLYHRLKGNKPDFHLAMQGEQAQQLYQTFLRRLGHIYDPTKVKGMFLYWFKYVFRKII